MKKHIRFYPKRWLDNRALRGCSPAARGFWVDLLCLCFPSGFLVNAVGAPLDDAQLSRMVGEPVKNVRAWIKELGEAGVFHVDTGGRLYSGLMVKEAARSEEAKAAGARGQRARRENPRPVAHEQPGVREETAPNTETPWGATAQPPSESTATTVARAAVVRPLDWWLTKAGWVRKGNEQALSMKEDEAFEDFQVRVAARLPMGRHLDVLTPGQVRAVSAAIPKDPNAKNQ